MAKQSMARLYYISKLGLHKNISWIKLYDVMYGRDLVPSPYASTENKMKKAVRDAYKEFRVSAYKKRFQQIKPVTSYTKKFVSSKDFYSSPKWRDLRYIALKNSGGCCTLCGAKAKDGITLHVDHIIPRSVNQAKQYDIDNLQILCEDCNFGKGNTDSIDWRFN